MKLLFFISVLLLTFSTSFAQDSLLYPAIKNKKYGFIDKTGTFIIEPQYDKTFYFKENGLATVQKDDKYGFINKNNEVIIPIIYDDFQSSNEAYYLPVINDSCYYLFDKKGEIIDSYCLVNKPKQCCTGGYYIYDKWVAKKLENEFYEIFNLDSTDKVKKTTIKGHVIPLKNSYFIHTGSRIYIFNYKGNYILDLETDAISSLNRDYDSLLIYKTDDALYNLNEIDSPSYSIRPSKYIYIDEKGNIKEETSDSILSYYQEFQQIGTERYALCTYKLMSEFFGLVMPSIALINDKNEIILKSTTANNYILNSYEVLIIPNQKLIALKDSDFKIYSIINFEGEIILKGSFKQVESIIPEKYIAVSENGKWKVFDVINRKFLDKEYDYIYPFYGELARIYQKDKTTNKNKVGYINRDFEVVYMEE
ncbi:WG repeat-containing protein (plasmid) [Bernardetia sp. Wsw4-3y2]|uniref:WG repeat-containing protein n=1 Tax=Bernardetia sp. Wsw4-3y2 TaxID=3127471 RepID=UPI0030D09DCA